MVCTDRASTAVRTLATHADVKLFQFVYSPYAAKVRKYLELKGLPFELVEVPYLDRRELAALTGGMITVPVLSDGETVVWESARITAYLDDRYPPSLRPAQRSAAASVFEAWADNVLEDVAFRLAAPAIEKRLSEHNGGRPDAGAIYRLMKELKFGPGCVDAWVEGAPALLARLQSILEPLEQTLAAQRFLLGERATLADAAVYGNLFMLEWGMPGWVQRNVPGLAPWYARVHEARDVQPDHG
jgi:glutathione S-transferase